MRFPFRFETTPWRLGVLPWGVTPGRTSVDLDDSGVRARFGPWRMDVPLANVRRWAIRGPYRWWRAVGVRMTVGVWDVSFGSSAKDGVYLEFVRPQRWFGTNHPALTVTVDDPEAFAAALRERGIDGADERAGASGG
ncbi:MAG TPA: hypothetical protein VGK63_06290 [Candidatus Limnocylindrales bacterium]